MNQKHSLKRIVLIMCSLALCSSFYSTSRNIARVNINVISKFSNLVRSYQETTVSTVISDAYDVSEKNENRRNAVGILFMSPNSKNGKKTITVELSDRNVNTVNADGVPLVPLVLELTGVF